MRRERSLGVRWGTLVVALPVRLLRDSEATGCGVSGVAPDLPANATAEDMLRVLALLGIRRKAYELRSPYERGKP